MYVRMYRVCLRTQGQECSWVSCRSAFRSYGALSDSLSFPLEPDGSLRLDLPAHLLLSFLSSLVCSVEEKSLSSWGYGSLCSSCTLRITSCCLAAKLNFQGRIWLVQMEPAVALDLIYNCQGLSITNKVARSPLSWVSNSLWMGSLRKGRIFQ